MDVTEIPRIQHDFPPEPEEARKVRLERLDQIKAEFIHAWTGYKEHAWLKDEVAPISGDSRDTLGGWAATLVDSLDTLWIMDLKPDFEDAVAAVNAIDFSTCTLSELNVFEATTRHLGGLLSAYDVSDGQYPTLLQKAWELGHMLYAAFDTPNRMPVTRWNFRDAADGKPQEASDAALSAEMGSLTLEFTRLSQLTGDVRFFDAAQRVMDVFDEQQNRTRLPGMWPVAVNARDLDFTAWNSFTIGGMADSLYEYLPKVRGLGFISPLVSKKRKRKKKRKRDGERDARRETSKQASINQKKTFAHTVPNSNTPSSAAQPRSTASSSKPQPPR
ncbi:Endoplasmic reticulum mannosyl-oligosaccharide 1,2-alpha-mannosidase [Diplodia seriata]|uniref:alpha-1,2-Mannosidase n=1 Tax=Diplodia seriata TaxID=420778 RepID=A0A1S8BK15_9PEZI|nr:Endoplasmic reticulum mannosyl-oligosaccharide 1,2-alpha-mannosidase [Diplodia seriata]